MRPIRRIFVSKDAISHFLKLVDLVFQQAALVIGIELSSLYRMKKSAAITTPLPIARNVTKLFKT
jgi:hypothetical protein